MTVFELKKILDLAIEKGMSDFPIILTVSSDDLDFNAELSIAKEAVRDDDGSCYFSLDGEELDLEDSEEVFNLYGVN